MPQVKYDYKRFDNIFDIESLQNMYVDTHYFPATKTVEIFYLSDVPHLRDFGTKVKAGRSAESFIARQIFKRNYSLRNLDDKGQLKMRFYDLRTPANLARYVHFWGVTPNKFSALNFMKESQSKGQGKPVTEVHPISDRAVYFAKRHHSTPRAKWMPRSKYVDALRTGKGFNSHEAMNMAWPYYTVKRTDPVYPLEHDKYGITMGFNSDNYDLTMIATFLGHVVANDYARDYLNGLTDGDKAGKALPLDHWAENSFSSDLSLSPKEQSARDTKFRAERQDLTGRILRPGFLRHYNDLLFTRYKKTMPQLLQHMDDLQPDSRKGSHKFFDQINNPAYWIYKGWMVSNRYLDVANLNEHMKFVPLKRIAAMEGWQILESKNVTANTKILHNLAQVADLIAYNNSDVQVTKLVFQDSQYQDALTLRRILLKKYPQLTYKFDRKSAFKRLLERRIKHDRERAKDVKQGIHGNAKTYDMANVKGQVRLPQEERDLAALDGKSKSKKDIESADRDAYSWKNYKAEKAVADPQDARRAPDNVQFSPLTDDASSAKLISNVIAPYHSMQDWPDIEYLFPDPRALKIFKRMHPEQHLEHEHPFNVLEDTMDWCKRVDKKYHLTGLPPADEEHVLDDGHSLTKTFAPIYRLYKTVEGHNVNATLDADAGKRKLTNIKGEAEPVGPSIDMTRLLHATNANIPYLHRDGNSTGTIATFSYGGIHGVEFKYTKFRQDYEHYLFLKQAFKQVKKESVPQVKQQSLFSNSKPVDTTPDPRIARKLKSISFRGHDVDTKQFVKGSGKHTEWKAPEPPKLYKHPSGSSYSLNDKYSYVSVDPVSHEDFSGYYPMLISRLGIMWPHDEPRDEYHHIYVERLHLKAELKKHTKNSPQWNDINQKQLLRKLLLNSASGAGDAKFFNTIRMNNKIVSMRIMGQLFTWRMAQSVCLADVKDKAKVTSSNTDGVYLAGLPDKVNNVALQRAVRPLSLFIGPVPLSRFVSKDANNRAEITNYGTEKEPHNVLTEAKGATLNAWQGPSVTATVSHPAIIDNVLAHYLAYQHDPCNQPLDKGVLMHLIDRKRKGLYSDDNKVRAKSLIFFQWVIASNPGKHRYPFLLPLSHDSKGWLQRADAVPIPHTNRLFLTKPARNTKLNTILALATRQKVNESTYRKKEANGETIKSDRNVLDIFDNWGDDCLPNPTSSNGYAAHEYVGRIAKMPGMPEHQNVHIENHSLFELTREQVADIADDLDYKAYLSMITQKYHASWDNKA